MLPHPRLMDRDSFIALFGDVFEHSPWIAAAAYDHGLDQAADTADGLHAALAAALEPADAEAKTRLIDAHPDLAGRLALTGALTAASTSEQAGAGLDRLTPAERDHFTALNDRYRARFGHPFIMAVAGATKTEILAAFERRLHHTPAEERATALTEISKIALLRIRRIFAETQA